MSEFEGQPIKDMSLSKGMKLDELVEQMYDSGGFTSKKVGIAARVFENMLSQKDCVKFLSFPACIVSTGTRGIIRDLIQHRMVDVVITTCGTLDHDIARTKKDYYHGEFIADDTELHRKGINRLGNIFIPNESYGIILEEIMQPILDELWDTGKVKWSPKELVWEFGKRLDNDNSIVYWARKNQIPVFVLKN